MSRIQGLKFLRSSYLPVLPLVYDNALSYIEQLGKVTSKLNELVEAVNDIEVNITADMEAIVDAKLVPVNARIDGILSQVDSEISDLRRENTEFLEDVTTEVNKLIAEVNNFNDALVATANAINQRTDMVVQQNNETLLNEMQRYLSNIKVRNFITGDVITIQEMFDFLCHYHLESALTYNELDAKDVTYNTLINYLMTYTQLITSGGSIIQ